MISSLMSALSPRVAYGSNEPGSAPGSVRYNTAVSVTDVGGVAPTSPAGAAAPSSRGSGSGGDHPLAPL